MPEGTPTTGSLMGGRIFADLAALKDEVGGVEDALTVRGYTYVQVLRDLDQDGVRRAIRWACDARGIE